MAFLGVDLGTSGLRVLLVSSSEEVIGAVSREYQTNYPYEGWAEQAPQLWLDALNEALAELKDKHSEFVAIAGIAVSGHMHGAVLVDRYDEIIRPCILWNDTRSHIEAAEMDEIPAFQTLSGNIVFPGFTAPKLEWLRKHEPENYQRIAKVVLPASYLNWYMTGQYTIDKSDASGTAWLDVGKRDWSNELLALGNMQAQQMPALVEGCESAGMLRPDLAQKWGLSDQVIIAGGAGDNAAAACGIGAMKQGQGFVSLGTSGVLLLAQDSYRPASKTALHTFCHAIPQRWYQMGVMLSATNSLNWLASISGKSPAELTNALGEDLRAPSTEHFYPYLSGERTPHNDASIRAAFTGLSTQTTLEMMTQSVLEGVAFGLRDSAEAMRKNDTAIQTLHAIGGGARSRYWLKLIATVLNTPLQVPREGEYGAALGAARLAKIAVTGEAVDSVMLSPKNTEEITPVGELVELFDQQYFAFQSGYPALKSLQGNTT